MDNQLPPPIEYRRARFAAQLPTHCLYTRAHFWLLRTQNGLWRVGLTKFASRMLGEMVDFGFEVPAQASIQVGQKLGWIEGFKAVSDLYSAAAGVFHGSNPLLEKEVTLVNKEPHAEGWLYQVHGVPDPACIDARAYASLLDRVIDELWRKQTGGEAAQT